MNKHLDGEKLAWSEDQIQTGVEVIGLENLQKIQAMNAAGQQVIFAPNHVKPNSKVRQQLALAEDYPKLQKVFKSFGLTSSVLFRGDTDMEIGRSKVKKLLYHIHRKIFSAIGRAYTGGGIPLAINAREPAMAMRQNISSMREIDRTLRQNNLTVFPYGNWFTARDQKFDDLEDSDFTSIGDFDKWRTSLKPGFVRIAKRAQVPIVPVYIDNTNGHWRIEFAEPIAVSKEDDNLETARKYLKSMKTMRNLSLLQAK